MFWFRHPKPFNQRPVVTQVAARKTQALPDMHVIVVEPAPEESIGAKSLPRREDEGEPQHQKEGENRQA